MLKQSQNLTNLAAFRAELLSKQPAIDIQTTITSLNVPDKMLEYLQKMKDQNDKIELATRKIKEKLDKLDLPYDRQSAQLYLESERSSPLLDFSIFC